MKQAQHTERNIIPHLGEAYYRLGRNLLQIAFYAFGIGTVAVIVSYPLWFWATSHRSSFSLFVLLVLILLLARFMYRGFSRQSSLNGDQERGVFILRPLIVLLKSFLLLIFGLSLFLSLSQGRWALALLIGVLFFLAFGLFYLKR